MVVFSLVNLMSVMYPVILFVMTVVFSIIYEILFRKWDDWEGEDRSPTRNPKLLWREYQTLSQELGRREQSMLSMMGLLSFGLEGLVALLERDITTRFAVALFAILLYSVWLFFINLTSVRMDSIVYKRLRGIERQNRPPFEAHRFKLEKMRRPWHIMFFFRERIWLWNLITIGAFGVIIMHPVFGQNLLLQL